MNTENLKQLPEIVSMLALLVASVCFFMLTDPTKVPAVMLIVGFALIYMTLYVALRLLIGLFGIRGRLTSVQYKAICMGGAALPTLLLALQSIGQLTVRDVITVTALFIAGCFYIMRLAPKSYR